MAIPEHEIADHLENHDTPHHVLHTIAHQQPGHDEFHAIASHPNASTETLQHIHATADQHMEAPEAHQVKMAAATHANAHPNMIKEALQHNGPHLYQHKEEYEMSGDREHAAALMTHPKLTPNEVHANVKAALKHAEDTKPADEEKAFKGDHESLVESWMKRQDVPKEHLMEMVQHPHQDFAQEAAKNKNADKDVQAAYLRRADTSHGEARRFLERAENLHPDVARTAYDKYKDPNSVSDQDEDRYYYDNGKQNRKQILTHIAGHKDTPHDIVREIGEQPAEEERNRWYNDTNPRQAAFTHPAYNKDEIHNKVMSGDDDALHASLKRSDTDSETLRHIDSKHPEIPKHGGHEIKGAIAHPNYPEDLMLKRVKSGSADDARAVLARQNVPESVLKELVNHKNKNVALEALDHDSVTPGVVETAYKRKMADVSRKASTHHMATPDMQMERVGKDPVAAQELAAKTNDQNLLHQLHTTHPTDENLLRTLIKNKNTRGDTLASVLNRLPRNLRDADDWRSRDVIADLARHPNLNRSEREHFMKTHPSTVAQNQNISGEELRNGLDYWKQSDDPNSSNVMQAVAKSAFHHNNTPKNLMMDLLSGTYGPMEGSTYDADHLATHPAVDNQVVNHGLRTQPELIGRNVVKKLAQSPHLTESDIKEHLSSMRPPSSRDSDDVAENRAAKMEGFAAHEHAPKEFLDKIMRAEPGHDSAAMLAEAIDNPKIDGNDLEKLYKEHATPGSAHEFDRNVINTLKGHLDDLGQTEDALKSAQHPGLVNGLVSREYGGINEENLDHALKNPNKNVINSLFSNVIEPSLAPDRRGREYRGNESIRQLVDQLADHPDSDIVARALPSMSAAGQEKARGKVNANDPRTIRGLRPDAVGNMKITPDMDAETARAILDHKGVTHDHLEQAVGHSPEIAHQTIRMIHADEKNKDYDLGTKEKIEKAALKSFGDNHGIARSIAENTKSPEILSSMMNDPEKYGKHIAALAENPKIKTADLDNLMRYSGDEYSHAFDSAAQSKKASPALLHHIAKHYPHLAENVASHAKVANAKVLKQVLEAADSKPQEGEDEGLAQERSIRIKKNLVNNEKVPQGIKDELVKDPKVLFAAKPENVTPEQLEQYATDKDPDLVNRVIRHNQASADVLDKAVQHVLNERTKGEDDSGVTMDSLDSAARHKNLSGESALKIAAQDPDLASTVISHQLHHLSDDHAQQIMDMHTKDGKLEPEISHALFRSSHYMKPGTAGKLVDSVDMDAKPGRMAMSGEIARLFDHNEDLATPENVDKAFSKLSSARPKNYKYKDEDDKYQDAELLKIAARKGSAQTAEALLKHPEMHGHLLDNKHLSKNGYDTIVSKLSPESAEEWGEQSVMDAINHPMANPESLSKIYKAIKSKKAAEDGDDRFRQREFERSKSELAKSKHASPALLKDIWNHEKNEGALKNPNLGSDGVKDIFHDMLANYERHHDKRLTAIASNPNFKLSMLDGVDKTKQNQNAIGAIYVGAVKNPNSTSDDLQYMYDNKDKVGNFKHLGEAMVKHANTPAAVVQKMLDNDEITEDDAFHSPSVGGKLWRSKKHEFPKNLGSLKPGKENNEATFRPREEKIKKIMGMIPEGGHLEWGDWKKANPSLAGDPVVQKMFTSAPKTRVTKEHAEKYLKEMPSKTFHVSYQKWDGMQRHNEKNRQLVVNINNHESTEKALKDDPKMYALYNFIQDASRNSGHPINPQAIGWSRVDTSHPDHWFIDEIQSDFNSMLSKEMEEIQKQGGSKNLEQKYGLTPEEGKVATEKMVAAIQGWEKALMNNIIETAKAHGVKKVSMHSGESKTFVNKGEKSEVTNKYNKIYNQFPQELGFNEDKYDNVPSKSAKSDLDGQKIWTLDLANPTPAQTPEQPTQKKKDLPKAG